MKRIESIQIYRGISILLIMLCHYFKKLVICGYIGVSAFLVMSGFLTVYMYNGVQINKNSIFKMVFEKIKRKISRYYTLFLFSTVISIPFCMLLIHDSLAVWKVIVHLLMLQAWVPHDEWLSVINGPSWYLSVDIFCTIISVPFILFCQKIKSSKSVLFLLTLTIVMVYGLAFLNITTPKETRWFWYFFPGTRWLDFVAGGLLGCLFKLLEKRRIQYVKIGWLWGCSVIMYGVGIVFSVHEIKHLEYAAVWLPASLILLSALFSSECRYNDSNIFFRRVIECKPMIFMGEISMELFLLHIPVMRYWVVLDMHLVHTNNDLLIALFSFMTVVILAVCWRNFKSK